MFRYSVRCNLVYCSVSGVATSSVFNRFELKGFLEAHVCEQAMCDILIVDELYILLERFIFVSIAATIFRLVWWGFIILLWCTKWVGIQQWKLCASGHRMQQVSRKEPLRFHGEINRCVYHRSISTVYEVWIWVSWARCRYHARERQQVMGEMIMLWYCPGYENNGIMSSNGLKTLSWSGAMSPVVYVSKGTGKSKYHWHHKKDQ